MMFTSKVLSSPIDFAARSETTGRVSWPAASACNSAARIAQLARELTRVVAHQVGERFQPESLELLAQNGTDAPQPTQRQRVEQSTHLMRSDHAQTIGFGQGASDLGHQLVGCHGHGHGQAGPRSDALFEPGCELERPPEQALRSGDVEERFVQRDRFDLGRELGEDRVHLLGDLGVACHVGRQKYALGTQSARAKAGHCRADPVPCALHRKRPRPRLGGELAPTITGRPRSSG